MTNHIEKLKELIPDGDGYNSEYAHTLLDAVEYIKQLEDDKKRMVERKCDVYEYQKAEGRPTHFEKVAIGKCIFHAWGCNYEEFEAGPGNFSTAIIEMPDGSVMNVPAEMIVFNN